MLEHNIIQISDKAGFTLVNYNVHVFVFFSEC